MRPGDSVLNVGWRVVVTLVGGVLVAIAPTVVVDVPTVGAHARLMSTVPAAESVAAAAPEAVELTFDETVEPVPGGLRVLAPDGQDVAVGDPTAAGRTLTQRVELGDRRGSFTVSYRVLSVDGHVVAGAYVFSVGERTATAGAEDRADPASRLLEVVGRAVASAGALLALGVVAVAALDVAPSGAALVRRRRLLVGAAVTSLFGTLLVLLGNAGQYAGSLGGAAGAWWDVAQATGSGGVVLARVVTAVAFVAVVAVPAVVSRAPALVAALALLLTISPAFGGHAVSSSVPVLAVTLVAVHLVAAACWLGALGAIAIRWAADRDLLGEYSTLALAAAPAVVLSGMASAWIQLGGPDPALGTTYGRLLLAKVLLAALILLLGWVNRRTVRRAAVAALDLAASVRLEAVLGVAVVAVSAVLVVTPPPADLPDPVRAEATAGELVARVLLTPGVGGPNRIELSYSDRAGAPTSVDATSLRVGTVGVEPRRVDVTATSPSTALADGVFLTPGTWDLVVTVVTEGRPSSVSFVVEIP